GQRKGFVPHEVGEGAPAKRGRGRPPEGSGRARLAASPPTHHPPLRTSDVRPQTFGGRRVWYCPLPPASASYGGGDLPPSLPLRGTRERLGPPRRGGRGPREAG